MFFIKKTKTIDKKTLFSGGYTIIEVMIVLTVSAALFGTTVFSITQQNRRNQFTESVLSFEQKLGDIVNDVETGYYPVKNNGSQGQGTNSGKIFIGKAVEGTGEEVYVYTLSGNQKVGDEEVANLEQAEPKALQGTDTDDVVESIVLSAGVKVDKIKQIEKGTASTIPGFAIISGLAQFTPSGGLKSGYNTRASLASLNSAVSTPDFLTNSSITNASKGILICLSEEGGGGRNATITIGESSQKLATKTTIDSDDIRCKI